VTYRAIFSFDFFYLIDFFLYFGKVFLDCTDIHMTGESLHTSLHR